MQWLESGSKLTATQSCGTTKFMMAEMEEYVSSMEAKVILKVVPFMNIRHFSCEGISASISHNEGHGFESGRKDPSRLMAEVSARAREAEAARLE